MLAGSLSPLDGGKDGQAALLAGSLSPLACRGLPAWFAGSLSSMAAGGRQDCPLFPSGSLLACSSKAGTGGAAGGTAGSQQHAGPNSHQPGMQYGCKACALSLAIKQHQGHQCLSTAGAAAWGIVGVLTLTALLHCSHV